MYDTNFPVTIEKLLCSINKTKDTIRDYEEYSLLSKLTSVHGYCINCVNKALETRDALFELNMFLVL